MEKALLDRLDGLLAARREEMVACLFSLVRIPSVRGVPAPGAPYGEECARALEKALSLCGERGLLPCNDEGYCGSALYGESGKRELALIAHLDVVPAGEGWSGDPFYPYLADGYAVGRGVRDNKNGAVCGLFALLALRELGAPLRHSLRLIFGCAEETGMDDLPHYLERHGPPAFTLVPDTAFPVCQGEKGIYDADLFFPCGDDLREFEGGGATNVVAGRAQALVRAPVSTKALAALAPPAIGLCQEGEWLRVTARGRPAHASRPAGSINAIGLLARYLVENRLVAGKSAASLGQVAAALQDTGGGWLGIAAHDAASGSLTCISGRAVLAGGSLRLNLDIRYPVLHRGGRITEGLRARAAAGGFGFALNSDSPPTYLPADSPAVACLTGVYEQVTGLPGAPYVMGGGTYARHLPNAVGFGPGFPGEPSPFPAGRGDCHQPDECQSVAGLLRATKLYCAALLALDQVVE